MDGHLGSGASVSVFFCLSTDTSWVPLGKEVNFQGSTVFRPTRGLLHFPPRVSDETKPCKYLNAGHIRDVIGRQTVCLLELVSIGSQLLCREEGYLSGCPASSAKVTVKI